MVGGGEAESGLDYAGMTKDVAFEATEESIGERIDAGHRMNYRDSPYMKPMISVRARAATISIMPREPHS